MCPFFSTNEKERRDERRDEREGLYCRKVGRRMELVGEPSWNDFAHSQKTGWKWKNPIAAAGTIFLLILLSPRGVFHRVVRDGGRGYE